MRSVYDRITDRHPVACPGTGAPALQGRPQAGVPQARDRLPALRGISVVVPARDEGEEARLTCESFLRAGADEVVLVDDGSTDGSCDPARLPTGVTVIRNAAPQGPAKCRNAGWQAATGGVIVFADAHMRYVSDDGGQGTEGIGYALAPVRQSPEHCRRGEGRGTLRAFAQAAIDRGAIVCAAVRPMDSERDWTGYGGRLVPDGNGAGYRVAYNLARPARRFARIGGLIGACYAIPRAALERMGGWVETLGWGYNEQALSMAAFFCGVPMLCDRHAVALHRFKRRFNYPASAAAARLNRFLAHRVLFDEDTFARHWLPRLNAAYPREAGRARALLATAATRGMAEDFRARKARGDGEWFKEAEQ